MQRAVSLGAVPGAVAGQSGEMMARAVPEREGRQLAVAGEVMAQEMGRSRGMTQLHHSLGAARAAPERDRSGARGQTLSPALGSAAGWPLGIAG